MWKGGNDVEEKIAIIGLFVEDYESATAVNELLHKNGSKIIGRMGIPYREQGLNIISVIVHATGDEISALSGSLGRLKGVTVRSMQTSISQKGINDHEKI